jgi:hypothetical protein
VDLTTIPDVNSPPPSGDAGEVYMHSYGPEPTSWDEAIKSKFANEWIYAKLAEQASFREHGVYDLVPRDEAIKKGKRIFKAKPVYKIKVKPPCEEYPKGRLDKFKYRLTIAAYTKMLKQGIDYTEKYASTVRWCSYLLLFALAAQCDYDVVLFDIATFFLYGILSDKEAVFMEQPDGWVDRRYPAPDWIWKLRRSMYGLPQASHCAQIELKKNLTDGGVFRATTADDCVYVKTDQSTGYAAVGTHVDDLLGVGSPEGIDALEATLLKKFKITVERNPSVVTGVQVERNREKKWLKLHQEAYIKELLTDYGMSDCNPSSTPFEPGEAKSMMLLPLPETVDKEVVHKYQSLVGRLIWLLKTRPDLCFTVNLLSRFLKNATEQHFQLARGRPLRYLRGTADYGLVFSPGDGDWVLSGKGDSDWAGDLRTGRSTLGGFLRMGEYGPVYFQSKLERKVASSTGQAETYGMRDLIKSTEWVRHLLDELDHSQPLYTKLGCDNDGVVKQAKKPINHTAAKHYRIAQAYIRDRGPEGSGHVDVVSIKSEDNGSDMFTKALAGPAFRRCVDEVMGPQDKPK